MVSHALLPPFPSQAPIKRQPCLFALILHVAFVSSALLLSACTAPPQFLSTILGPVPTPKPVEHKPRREPYQPPKPAPMVEVKEEAPRTDWAAMLEQLPKDAGGGTDWVRAMDEKLIDPKPGLDPKAEDEPVFDMDLELVPKDAPDFKATYPHKIHTRMLACTNCHMEIFQMEKGADPITMEKIFAGEYCGRCHGKVAFDVATGCPRCHLGMPK
ncbi:MAG: hypothetical protein HY017_26005 [Betaproteobacteria bacterium]|nr:hypothetical protein [Betaproteobacteria bacterium]